MANGVRANARREPPLGRISGSSPDRSSASTRASSSSISASVSPTCAPRASRSSRMSGRWRSIASMSGDQWSYSSFEPLTSAPCCSRRSNMSLRLVSIATWSACGRPPQNGCGPTALTIAGVAASIRRTSSIRPTPTNRRKSATTGSEGTGLTLLANRERLLAIANRIQVMLRPDQQPVADDRRRRHRKIVERVDADEAVFIGRLDDVRVALFAQKEDEAVVRPG